MKEIMEILSKMEPDTVVVMALDGESNELRHLGEFMWLDPDAKVYPAKILCILPDSEPMGEL